MIVVLLLAAGLLSAPVAKDDFNRPDGPIDGSIAPSGQAWTTNVPAGQEIRNGRYVSDVAGGAKIAYISLDTEPTFLEAEFVFTDGDEQQQNAVIGTAERGFGLGSVQLAVWRNHWRLFIVEHPIVDPYPTVMAGAFDEMLPTGKPYRMAIRFEPAQSAIVVETPDGRRHFTSHPALVRYWGPKVGMQQRRPNRRSGTVEFLSISAR